MGALELLLFVVLAGFVVWYIFFDTPSSGYTPIDIVGIIAVGLALLILGNRAWKHFKKGPGR